MKEMETGNYTPTNVSASLEKRHRDQLKFDENVKTFELAVDPKDPLPHTDGNHRFEALFRIAKKLKANIEKAEGAEKEKLERWLKQVYELPVTVTVYFDGSPVRDFVNLQAGRTVDASHMQSLSLMAGLVKDPVAKSAHETAKLLHKDDNSPFKNSIKFDSRGCLPLPISTLTARGASDAGTSLIGLAKLGQAFKKKEEFLAGAVVAAYEALKKVEDEATPNAHRVLAPDKLLTPLANHGTKGSSTMLVGIGLCLAYRLIALKKDVADEADLIALIVAAHDTLDKEVAGNLSGQVKRGHLGDFAKVFFADLADADAPKHKGIPVELLKTLSCSAFAVEPMPKATRGKSPK